MPSQQDYVSVTYSGHLLDNTFLTGCLSFSILPLHFLSVLSGTTSLTNYLNLNPCLKVRNTKTTYMFHHCIISDLKIVPGT